MLSKSPRLLILLILCHLLAHLQTISQSETKIILSQCVHLFKAFCGYLIIDEHGFDDGAAWSIIFICRFCDDTPLFMPKQRLWSLFLALMDSSECKIPPWLICLCYANQAIVVWWFTRKSTGSLDSIWARQKTIKASHGSHLHNFKPIPVGDFRISYGRRKVH